MITDQVKLFNHNSNTKFRLEDSIPKKKLYWILYVSN